MNKELPRGWVPATIGDVAIGMKNGLYKPASYYIDNGIACLRMYNIDAGRIVWKDIKRMKLTREEVQEYQLLPNDLLINRVNSRELVGKAAIILPGTEQCVFESKNIRLRLNKELVYPELVNYRLLLSGSQHFIHNAQQVVGMASISQPQVAAFELPLPPLAEQGRIVAKLGKVLSKVGSCQQRLARIPPLLKRFRQSVLAAACSGLLTADWREENPNAGDSSALVAELERVHEAAGGHKQGNAAPPTDEAHDLSEDQLPSSWCITEMRTAVCPDRPITYGILKPGPDTPNGVPYVRVADFPNDTLKLESIRRTTKIIDQMYARARLREGDILISIRGTVGRICVVPRELDRGNITQDTARLSIQPALNAGFVKWFLRAAPTQKRMQKAVKGVAVRGINIGDVRALQLPVPPLPEQQEIVRRVEALFALADRIEARFAVGRKQIASIGQSILARAFRGELVPTEAELAEREGRSYESASELLDRIRATSSNAGHGNRSKPRKPKTLRLTSDGEREVSDYPNRPGTETASKSGRSRIRQKRSQTH
jgi:type I restriction enzyme, S subunit